MTPNRDGKPSAWGVVAFLLLLHIVNQIDRQLIGAFAADIMRDLDLSRSQFALIAGFAFSGVYSVAALAAGILADRHGQRRVLAVGLAIWSLFTALAGLARGFWTMLITRPLVAAGEATLVPTATNLILARVAEAHKAAALGLFFAGIPLGIGAGFLIAGQLGPLLGWRGTFMMMGAIGLVALATLTRFPGDPPRGQAASGLTANLSELWLIYRRSPRVRWSTLAMIAAHAHVATNPFVQLWLTSEKGLDRQSAASLYGLAFVSVGLIGTIGSGLLGDWAKRRLGWDRAWTVLVLLLVLAPMLPVYRLASGGTGLFLAGMVASILFMTVVYGPLFAIIQEQLPDHLKATSSGVVMLGVNIAALGGVALLVGWSSDLLAAQQLPGSWTWPLLGADLLAVLALPLTWLAFRARERIEP